MGGVCGITIIAAVLLFIYRVIIWRQTQEQIACFIEAGCEGLENRLINPLLLKKDKNIQANPLVEQNINQCAHELEKFNLSAALLPLRTKILRLFEITFFVLIISTGICVWNSAYFKRGFNAIVNPADFVQHVNKLNAVEIAPGDTSVFVGRNINVTIKFDKGTNFQTIPAGRIIFRNADDEIFMRHLNSKKAFTASIKDVQQGFEYAIQFGKNRWPADKAWFAVNVIEQIEVKNIRQEITYPSYTKLPAKIIEQTDGTITAPLGSSVKLSLSIGRTVPNVNIETSGGKIIKMKQEDSKTFYASLNIIKNDNYRLALLDKKGETIQNIPDINSKKTRFAGSDDNDGMFTIRTIKDNPPIIKITSPGRDITAGGGENFSIQLIASDQYELDKLEIFWKTPDGKTAAIFSQKISSDNKKVTCTKTLPSNLKDKADSFIEYFAVVSDTRNIPELKLKPQSAASKKFRIRIQDSKKIEKDNQLAYENLKSMLMEILNLQLTMKINTTLCQTMPENLEEINTSGMAIPGGQNKIKDQLAEVIDKTNFSRDLYALKNELSQLWINEVSTAVQQANLLVSSTSTQQLKNVCENLGRTQDIIIQSLRSILALMPELANKENPQELPDQPAQRKKLKELSDKLKELQAALARSIKDTSKLPNTPTDNFTQENEKLLANLKSALDKWDKFLDDTFSDFSKLRLQDFSNPQMLEELLAVKCDVTMARDALSSKAKEIATAMEQNGLENAETLTANLEKWLPDVADREKWAMEAPDTFEQENIEMPDLPSQLERTCLLIRSAFV